MKRLLPLLLSTALLLTACGAKKPVSSAFGEIAVYRVFAPEYQTSGELLCAEKASLPQGADPVAAAAEALAKKPESQKLKSPLPANVRIFSAEHSGSNVKLTMSAGYILLSGMDKTILDSCLALTFCSIEGVDSVSTYIGDDMVEESLRAGDILLQNTVKTPVEAKVRLYYPADHRLRCEYRAVSIEDGSSPERAVVEALLGGPKSEGLYPALPAGTVLLSVYTQEGVCTVSLSEDFVASCTQQPENATYWVYSLVNTLCSLSTVSSVSLLVEGKSMGTVGNCDISRSLVKNEKLTGSPVL